MNKLLKNNTFKQTPDTISPIINKLLNQSTYQAKCEYTFPQTIIVLKSYMPLDDLCLLKNISNIKRNTEVQSIVEAEMASYSYMISSIFVNFRYRGNSLVYGMKYVCRIFQICVTKNEF